MFANRTYYTASQLTHWHPNEIERNTPLNSWQFFHISEQAQALKINHTQSNHTQIRFQDLVYFKLNKWRAKILKNINNTTQLDV